MAVIDGAMGVSPSRAALLEEGNRLHALYREVGYTPEGKAAIKRVFELHGLYKAALPEVVLSRCPLTGKVVRRPFDSVDLDGWYWDWRNPVRRLAKGGPSTWPTMSGAVRLANTVTSAPFECMPGPDAPYVLPELLNVPDVRAVVAQIPIGRHTGWAMTYFGSHRPTDVPLENIWGSGKYDNFQTFPHTLDDYDFELRPWIDSGKLLWIATGDADATLHEGRTDCPYLDFDAQRRNQWISQGAVRTDE
ncbi:hypothetical protein ACWDOP_03405 [Nocardia sp. NPDC003693]